MEIGHKIKQLRYKSGLTQDQLAEQLGLSSQSVSKWENLVAMPDITMLPRLAEVFGVSIDELFDLTREQKLNRIENRMDAEGELPGELFWEYEEYLKEQLDGEEPVRILSLLARLYHHRMESDARKVSRYARKAIKLAPERKECQWLLQMAEGQAPWDWNVANHAGLIDFYKEVIQDAGCTSQTPLPYYYLIDILIADHRTKEAREYLDAFSKLPGHRKTMVPIYQAHIALAEFDENKAERILEKALADHPGDGVMLFEAAQFYARKCDYEKAIAYYEQSYAVEADHKPRYIDALQGIAMIYEILGDYPKAAATYDRILDNLKNEWGFTEEWAVQEAEQEKNRILQKMNVYCWQRKA